MYPTVFCVNFFFLVFILYRLHMASAWLVIGDGLSFFIYLVLVVWELFVSTSLNDLESDIIAAKDLCDQLNPFILPAYMLHAGVCLLILCCNKWFLFLLQIPVLVIHIQKYRKKKIRLDFMSVRRADVLEDLFKYHYAHVAFYLLGFLWTFIAFANLISSFFI